MVNFFFFFWGGGHHWSCSHTMFTGYILQCQEVITIVMNSWYCSERPPWKKDRATPWPVLLCFIHRGLGGLPYVGSWLPHLLVLRHFDL